MLVCTISQAARRVAIAADIAEHATAADALGTGNVIFAALVDDPASVRERIDAYLGEIMVEAASAAATANAGMSYAAAISEAAFAVDVPTGAVPTVWSAAVSEATTAAATQDAAVTAAAITRSAMLPQAIVNSSGTARSGNIAGTQVKL